MTSEALSERVDHLSLGGRRVHLGQLLLTLLLGLFYGIGWLAAKLCKAVVWMVKAVVLGWREGWNASPRTRRHELS